MKILLFKTLASVMVALCVTTCPSQVAPVNPAEAAAWIKVLLPLPHEVNFSSMVRLKRGELNIKLRSSAGVVEQQVRRQLEEQMSQDGAQMTSGGAFTIMIGVADTNGMVDDVAVSGYQRLLALPNPDQAYLIEPQGTNQLLVTGLSERGVNYGVRTLMQLLKKSVSGGNLAVPLVSIVDWPDYAERGFWKMPLSDIPWLASMKLNQFQTRVDFYVNSNRTIVPQIRTEIRSDDPEGQRQWIKAFCTLRGTEMGSAASTNPHPLGVAAVVDFEQARHYGAEVVPFIMHLDLWEYCCQGFAEAFPELIGKGEHAKDRPLRDKYQRVLCASNPALTVVLQDLMTQLAAMGATREINVFLSEYSDAYCECDACMQAGQFQSETMAVIRAWKGTQKTYPALRLTVFFGVGGGGKKYPEKAMADVAALLLEHGVKLGLANGFPPEIRRQFIQKGGWASEFGFQDIFPWRRFSAEAIRARAGDDAMRKHKGICQVFDGVYYSDVRAVCDYNLSAIAEYTWNAAGRSEKEFAEAWATRNGYNRPEVFGECMEIIGAPDMRALQSRMWACWGNAFSGRPGLDTTWLGRLPGNIKNRKMDQSLNIKTNADLAVVCARASQLSQSLHPRDLTCEIQCLVCYNELEKQGARLLSLAASASLDDEANKNQFGNVLHDFEKALAEYKTAMYAKIDQWGVSLKLNQAMKAGAVSLDQCWTDIVRELSLRYVSCRNK